MTNLTVYMYYSWSCFLLGDLALIQPHVGHMTSFIEHIALDEDHSESNISACCGLIGYVSNSEISFDLF